MNKYIKLLSISFLLFINFTFSQTKEETQAWISEKINYNSYSDDIKIFYNYTISFDETNMIIKSNCRTIFSGFDSTSDLSYIVPIKDLHKIRFESKSNNVWLYLKTKSNSIKIDGELKNQVEILLENSFLENDMRNRMDKAFTNLIKLYGGSVGEEKF